MYERKELKKFLIHIHTFLGVTLALFMVGIPLALSFTLRKVVTWFKAKQKHRALTGI